jgi:DNA invertase Pin-like site-specific DNA recombinase
MKELVCYLRVSTEDQGKAGNGLEAQQAAIEKFAADNNYKIIEVVTEVASGKLGLTERPVLNAAISKALKAGATVVVSKLDRLSRNAAFILNLMETKVRFIVTELGEDVQNLTLHIFACMAEHERKIIGERTKAALAVLKAKGVKLGNPKSLSQAGLIGRAANTAKADEFATRMKTSVQRMLEAGMSYNAIAKEFNMNGTKTARGGVWSACTVSNLVVRF